MKKILVIDDESFITDVISKMLENQYDVVTETDARKALETINNTELDLIVTDVVMPGLDGVQLVDRIRRDRKSIPIIMMSGNPVGRKFLYAAHGLGATGVLTKPFTQETLTDTVARALDSSSE